MGPFPPVGPTTAADAAETTPEPAPTKRAAKSEPAPAPAPTPPASNVATTLGERDAATLVAPIGGARLIAQAREPKPETGRAVYVAATVASLLWLGGITALVVGYNGRIGPFALDAFGLAVLALIALAPIGFVWAGAYAISQAGKLAAEAGRARRLTDEMVGPTAVAAAHTGQLVESLRTQIFTATEVANQARDHLLALREALALETEKLAEATASASRTAVKLVETLSKERGELNTLAVTLDARSAAVTDAINRQARMVAEASDLAETQLREAEAALAARAADLAAAAGEATDISRIAGEDLSRQVARLETAGVGVGDQMRALEDGLTQQRAALVTVAHTLRADQEEFASLAETRTAQLAEFLGGARIEVQALNESTVQGAQSLSELIAEAGRKFHELAQAASGERELFSQSALESLQSLSEAGAREREHLESAMRSTIEALSVAATEAREAADVHAEAARARVDQLNEAAFGAGQKADQVFEARLSEARGLIEQSARLVEDAGAATAQRLEGQVETAREALASLRAMMDEIGERAERLPQEASAKADEVRQAMERGLGDLLTSARQAAEETQAIDAAFQERVRRNYEMLSEAVQLMGVVASGGQGAAVLQRPSAADRAQRRVTAAASQAAIEPPAATPPTASEAASRSKLKLTPTATDAEFKAVFDAAGGPPAAAQDKAEEAGWTWKDLLTSIDGEAAGDDAQLGGALFAEIQGMGIDPGALLPKSRTEEIAAAVQTQDGAGAREVVRTLAPAAIRRIARRLLSDAGFRTRAQTLVGRYAVVLDEAVKRDKGGFQAAALLTSDVGRAYLLLDAAAGQQG
ncbi:MAG: polar localization protein TipN [Caulobacterales bacterium]